MTAPASVERYFRSRSPAWEAPAFLRSAERGGVVWMAVANASEGGFSTVFTEGSGFLLDVAEREFRAGRDHQTVLRRALSEFFGKFPADPADDWSDPTACVLMVWAGRSGPVAASCGPQELRIEAKDGSMTAWPPDEARFVLNRPPIRIWTIAHRSRPPQVTWGRWPLPRAVELRDIRLADALAGSPLPPSLDSMTSEAPILAAIRWVSQEEPCRP